MRELCPEGGKVIGEIRMPLDVSNSDRWYALTVKHQHERPVLEALEFKGWKAFSPMYRTHRQWSDRVHEVDLPLFAGYVFCRFPYARRISILNTPAVGSIVAFGGLPTPVEEQEIEQIQALVSSGRPVRPWPYLRAGDRIRVERGPLRGAEGIVLHERDNFRLVVSVELLQRSVAVEVDPDTIVPLRSPHSAGRLRAECRVPSTAC